MLLINKMTNGDFFAHISASSVRLQPSLILLDRPDSSEYYVGMSPVFFCTPVSFFQPRS